MGDSEQPNARRASLPFLTTKQLSLLHVAKRRLGLDDDTYRAILDACGGVRSARDLNTLGFDTVMAYFARLGFKSTAAKRNFGASLRPGMATANQVGLIRRLWSEWSGGALDSDAALNRWLEKHFRVSALRVLDAAGAHKAINGLKRMVARKKGEG